MCVQLEPFLTHPSHHELMQFSGGRDVELRVGDEVDNWSNEKDRTLIEALLIQSRYVCTHGFDSSMMAC